MNYKVVSYGSKAERRNYAKIKSSIELPNLIAVQTKSFQEFLKTGIGEVFKEFSPILNHNEDLSVSFGDYWFEEESRTFAECKIMEKSYTKRLKCNVTLENHTTGEIIEEELFMGDMQMMTDQGTFVINGSERVIVSQIVRSSGVFYSSFIDKKTGGTKYIANAIPTRGAWIEYEVDSKDIAYAKLDKSKKICVSTFLRAIGFDKETDMVDMFGGVPHLKNSFDKDQTTNSKEAVIEVFKKLKQGDTVPFDAARDYIESRLFDNSKYDLAEVGRFKYNKRLDVLLRAHNLELAEDIVNKDTGEVIMSAGEIVTEEKVLELSNLRDHFRHNANLNGILLEEEVFVEKLAVNVRDGEEVSKVVLVGNDNREERLTITLSDIIATASIYFNLYQGVGKVDDIDHLGNRRLRLIGELVKNQFRKGMLNLSKNIRDRMSTFDSKDYSPQSLINIKPLTSALKEFYGTSQLSQFMDQINPLAELTHKRRISSLGTGGLSKDRAGVEVRDVHFSHYGRMCPIETPEGPSIGLITSLATFADVDRFGFLKTPYFKVTDGKVDRNSIEYLTADIELKHTIASAATALDENDNITEQRVIARNFGQTSIYSPNEIEYIEVSPQQIVSVSTACIPFLEHDDANRALMGANMQRQALPLVNPDSPIVGTGMEHRAAKDSGVCVTSKVAGKVTYVDSKYIMVTDDNKKEHKHICMEFFISNQGTAIHQRPIVSVGDEVEVGDILADGPSCDNGEMALGQNVVVAFMTWDGYNYEDAIVMSERLVKEDVYTSIHVKKYEVEARDTKLGAEEITREIPNASSEQIRYLDETGIIIPGAEVKEGDYLVGKITPKGHTDPTPEEKLLLAIFGEKSREVKDTSKKIPHGGGGVVQSVHHLKKSDGHDLPPGVNEVVRVYVIKKRKIREGDKMAGRHGNKGVISRILPIEDMPYMKDGTPVDIMLNPLGVPSRMNIGQILEIHLGMAAKQLGIKVATPVFDGVSQDDLMKIMEEAGMEPDGKRTLYDGRTGEKYDNRISVGVMYMIKLSHMVDDKLHARAVGPYTLVTQQPMGGKAQNGGQRFGEMEVWALEAYGAAYTLQEMLTVKSDDIIGRNKVFRAIVDGKEIPEASIPESFRVLTRELQALGIHVELINEETGENEVQKSLVEHTEDYISKFGFNK